MGCINSQSPRCKALPSSLQNLLATIGYTCTQPPDKTCGIKETEFSQFWSAPRKGDKPNLAVDTRQVENVRLSHNNCGPMQQPSKLGYRMGPQRNDQHLTIYKLLVTQHSKVGEEKPKCAIRLNKDGQLGTFKLRNWCACVTPGGKVWHTVGIYPHHSALFKDR